MIPTVHEILYRAYGAWRLARFDAAGAQYFDESLEAAIRSFFAAALVAPAYIVITLLWPAGPGTQLDPLIIFLVYLLDYSLSWTVFPVIAYRVCQEIGHKKFFFRFVSANNWTSLIGTHTQLVVAIVIAGGIVPEGLAVLLQLALSAYLLAYQWFITRHCLDVSAMAAIGFVALWFLINVFLNWTVAAILV